jgi:hypothetical protein
MHILALAYPGRPGKGPRGHAQLAQRRHQPRAVKGHCFLADAGTLALMDLMGETGLARLELFQAEQGMAEMMRARQFLQHPLCLASGLEGTVELVQFRRQGRDRHQLRMPFALARLDQLPEA